MRDRVYLGQRSWHRYNLNEYKLADNSSRSPCLFKHIQTLQSLHALETKFLLSYECNLHIPALIVALEFALDSFSFCSRPARSRDAATIFRRFSRFAGIYVSAQCLILKLE